MFKWIGRNKRLLSSIVAVLASILGITVVSVDKDMVPNGIPSIASTSTHS